MNRQVDGAPNAGASPARRRALACASYAAGLMLAPLAGFLAPRSLTALDISIVSLLLHVAALVLVLLVQIVLAVAAEGFLVPSGREVCANDPRAPVLFLRPFDEDQQLTYDVISAGETTTVVTASAEDFLLALNAVGPLISISEPGWSARLGYHPLGAFRDYVDPDQWQQRVEQLLDQAGMVVLAVGDSPGIEWEIGQVRQRISPQSLLVYLPPRPVSAVTHKGRSRQEREIYERFKPMIERQFGIELPPFGEQLYVIGFDASGTSIMVPDAPRSHWALSEHQRVADAITSQLKTVLARTRPGIDLDHYRVPGRAAALWRLFLAVGVFVAAIGLGLWSSM